MGSRGELASLPVVTGRMLGEVEDSEVDGVEYAARLIAVVGLLRAAAHDDPGRTLAIIVESPNCSTYFSRQTLRPASPNLTPSWLRLERGVELFQHPFLFSLEATAPDAASQLFPPTIRLGTYLHQTSAPHNASLHNSSQLVSNRSK